MPVICKPTNEFGAKPILLVTPPCPGISYCALPPAFVAEAPADKKPFTLMREFRPRYFCATFTGFGALCFLVVLCDFDFLITTGFLLECCLDGVAACACGNAASKQSVLAHAINIVIREPRVKP